MSLRTKALLAIFVAAVLWASAGATAKILFQEAPPLVAAFHRFFLASILIFPFFLKAKKPKGFVRTLLPLGLFNAGNIFFYYTGIARTTANTSTIIGTAVPLTTMLLSWLLIREHISPHKLMGVLIGLLGTSIIVLTPVFQKGSAMHGDILGNILLVCSLISWSFYITYSRSLLSKGLYSPLISTSMNIFVVTIATGIGALIVNKSLITQAIFVPSYIGVLTYAAIGITISTFFLFQWGVQHVTATTASLKEYLQLVLGFGLNALLLGERLTGEFFIGGALVAIGVLLATGDKISRKFSSLLFSQGE